MQREELVRQIAALAGQVEELKASEPYEVCEFYYFRNPIPRPGFMPATGELLENAAVLYPQARAFLQAPEGQGLCISEEEWQAMSRAVRASRTDGAQVGWNGTGGVPFYAAHQETGSLRLPDLRGMYAEAAGFEGLDVGGVHLDQFQGHGHISDGTTHTDGSGSVVRQSIMLTGNARENPPASLSAHDFRDPSRLGAYGSARVGSSTKPPAWGALACVFLGRPAA